MRKIISVITTVAMLAIIGCSGDTGDHIRIVGVCGSGDGDYYTPYVLCSFDDLEKIKDNIAAHYVLKNDIAAPNSIEWTPIGGSKNPFKGSLSGNGFTISNLKISGTGGEDYVGLFGNISGGTVNDLRVLLAAEGFAGRNYIGVIAGKVNNKSTIIDCYAEGNLQGRNIIGGIVGEVKDSIVRNSKSRGVIKASGLVGGIVGNLDSSDIENLYSNMDINAQNYAGGIVGKSSEKSRVSKCYATGSVIGTDTSSTHIGGIVGGIYDSELRSNFALNSNISGRIFVNKVAGDSVSSEEDKNYAISSLLLFGMQNAGIEGLVLAENDAKNQRLYEESGWLFGNSTSEPWNTTGENYPQLFFEAPLN